MQESIEHKKILSTDVKHYITDTSDIAPILISYEPYRVVRRYLLELEQVKLRDICNRVVWVDMKPLVADILINERDKYPNEEPSVEFYKNLLTRDAVNQRFVVIGSNVVNGEDTIVPMDIAQYICKNELLSCIYRICQTNTYANYGFFPLQVLHDFIFKGRKIQSMSHILELDKDYFGLIGETSVLGYIRKKYEKDINVMKLDGKFPNYMKMCVENGIHTRSLVYRVECLNMGILDAINIGKQERNKYGLVTEYSRNSYFSGTQLFTMNYIRYLIAKETNTKPVFIQE